MNPRIRGIEEHIERIRLLDELADAQQDPQRAYRLHLAAIYSCRAVVEIVLEGATLQVFRNPSGAPGYADRPSMEAELTRHIPHYGLIERIRIHDFHRFGLAPPNPQVEEMFWGGPLKLVAQQGSVAAVMGEEPQFVVSGQASVKDQRSLVVKDGRFFDEASRAYVDLAEVVKAFLRASEQVRITVSRLTAP